MLIPRGGQISSKSSLLITCNAINNTSWPPHNLTCIVEKKCLNIHKRLEIVERNTDDFLPFPVVLWIAITRERRTLMKKYG